MTSLLEAKEYIKSFYSKYEIYVTPVLKFLAALIGILAVNSCLGYMSVLKNPALVAIVALMCSFMPMNFIIIVAAAFVLGHAYALSAECAVVVLAVFLLMFLLYFRFSPKDTVVVLFTPILFVLKIPYVMPVAMGLLSSPVSVISVSCGVVVYYMMQYMADNVAVFSAMDAETSSQKLRLMIDGILDNKAMFATVLIFALILILVYVIRRMSMDYAWIAAIITGLAVDAVLLLVCEFVLEVNFSVAAIFLGSLGSFLVCMIIQFLTFNVDYSRTERVQFEDDEYYYYVKAVPKNVVAVPEKKVKRINKQRKKAPVKQVKRETAPGEPVKNVSTIKTSHGVSRTTVQQSDNTDTRARQD